MKRRSFSNVWSAPTQIGRIDCTICNHSIHDAGKCSECNCGNDEEIHRKGHSILDGKGLGRRHSGARPAKQHGYLWIDQN